MIRSKRTVIGGLLTISSLSGCDPVDLDESPMSASLLEDAPLIEAGEPEQPPLSARLPPPEPTPGPHDNPDGLAAEEPPPQMSSSTTDPYVRVEGGTSGCTMQSTCVDSIPMTGRVSPLFESVDQAMRQFMQIHCAGGGVLAVSRNGRRVYKRGFGRTKGAASVFSICGNDQYDGFASPVRPDMPFHMASVTKFVTAAATRMLVKEYLLAQQPPPNPIDPSAVLVVDVLPSDLRDYYLHTAGTGTCAPVPGWLTTFSGSESDPRNCGTGQHPDDRWTDVTVGDLIGHTSFMAGSDADAGFFDRWGWLSGGGSVYIMSNLQALRGINNYWDWIVEYLALSSTTKYPTELEDARDAIAAALDDEGVTLSGGGSVSDGNILFIDHYNSADGWTPVEDYLIIAAGNAFAANPAGATDDSPGTGTYSNQNYRMLGRIAAHLHATLNGGEDLWAAPDGFPELHDDTALGWFLAQNGIDRGIWSEHAIFNRQHNYAPGYEDPTPWGRSWSNGSYESMERPNSRPWCLLDGNNCDFSFWMAGDAAERGLAPEWDFSTGSLLDPAEVPRYRNEPTGWITEGGGLAMEMPALLTLLDRYAPEGSDTTRTRMGMPIDEYDQKPGTAKSVGKNGSYPGTSAQAWKLRGSSRSGINAPPADPLDDGKLTLDVNWSSSLSWTDPDDVDFAVAVNQDSREGAVGNFGALANFVRYGLRDDVGNGVDWDAVDRMIHHQRRHVVGMSFDANGNTFYWYEGDGNITDVNELGGAMGGNPGAHFGSTYYFYDFIYEPAATRIGTDVLGVAIKNAVVDTTYMWYDDGHYSAGSIEDPSTTIASGEYTLPSALVNGILVPLKYDQLIDVAFSSSGSVYSWYTNGTVARGIVHDLDSVWTSAYVVPTDQRTDEVEAVAIDWANANKIWARYRDGSVSRGTTSNLGYYTADYHPARPVAMSITGNITTMWYANGWYRKFDGMPIAAFDGSNQVESGYWHAGDGDDPSDYRGVYEIIGAAESNVLGTGRIGYWDAETAPLLDGVPDASTAASYPTGYGPLDVIDFAMDSNGVLYTYFDDGTRAVGDSSDLDSISQGTDVFSVTPGLSYADIAAIAMTDGGEVWTMYDNGVVSWGTDTDLDDYGTFSP